MPIKSTHLALRLLCIPIMLVLIVVTHSLRVPNPILLLIIPVVYFTYTDGYWGGALSGLPILAYTLYDSLHEMVNTTEIARSATVCLSLTAIILLTGHFQVKNQAHLTNMEQRNKTLFHMASTDKLTGAANRHGFFDLANTAYENSIELHSPLAALFIDVDHFKMVNDTWGHSFGDQVLMRLSEVINSCLRGSDLCCRYGGEEFLVLLLHSDCTVACTVAERIMEKVRSLRFPDCPNFRFTVSIGIAAGVPSDQQCLEDFINGADCAMYQAKKSGRDRSVLRMVMDGVNTPQ